MFFDLRGDEARLVLGVERLIVAYPLARRVRRPERLIFAFGVMADDVAGGVEDRLRRAIVLFKLDRLRVRILLLEVEYVRDVCAAPTID